MEASLVVIDACAWPVLTRLSATKLGLVYFNRPSHGLEEGDLTALVSTDGGRTWQPAGVPAPHDSGANRMHIAAGVDHAGRWIVLSTGFRVIDGKYGDFQPLWCSTGEQDSDGAYTWHVQRTVTVRDIGTGGVIPHGRVLALPDGRLAATCYRSFGRGRPAHAWCIFSRDGGRTWEDARRIGRDDANEAVLARLSDARFLAVARTQADHHVALHVSSDRGATWQYQRDLTLPMQHPADLTDLGERGLLLTYGIRNRGLMGIGARLSRDSGNTWSAPVVLHIFGDATDCGYPSTVESEPGTLLTACYSDLSPLHAGYHLLTLRWHLDNFFAPRPLRSISDGGPLST